MYRVVSLAAIVLCCSLCLAATPVEVLYVAQTQGTTVSLQTYHVDPTSAAATPIGSTITVGAQSMDAAKVNGMHLLYIWDSTDVWMYKTNSSGVPNSKPSQHLTFNFAHTVNTFLVDPDGKFAYAVMTWYTQGNNYAAINLFTINQTTGLLTNTGKTVANYGPNQYTYFTAYDFVFGRSGGRLYASWAESAPFTFGIGYDFYPVNQTTGQLGALNAMSNTETFNCTTSCGIGVTDAVTATSGNCCGAGAGALGVYRTATGQSISCNSSMLSFCGDDVSNGIFIDPSSQNIFFPDATTNQIDVGHIDFTNSQLLATSSTIPGIDVPIVFSPDSRLVFALSVNGIYIEALQASTGNFTAQGVLSVSGSSVSAAAITL